MISSIKSEPKEVKKKATQKGGKKGKKHVEADLEEKEAAVELDQMIDIIFSSDEIQAVLLLIDADF